MKNLADFLQKFKAIRDPSLDKKIIAYVIKQTCGVDIEPSNIKIKNFVIQISEHPAIKTSIYMKKQSILELINKELPGRNFSDIN